MALLALLFQHSRMLMALSLAMGFISGSCSAGIIALVSWGIASADATDYLTTAAWGFGALTAISLVTSIVSQVMLIRLSQSAILQLRNRLARQILASQLNFLEQLGQPRLLATLTEDIQSISSAVFVLPFLCIDLAIVIGCFLFISLLSVKVLGLVLALMVAAIGSCQLLIVRGNRWIAMARDDQDRLYKHFRTIVEGIKELKLHVRRRRAFLVEDLDVTANRFRSNNVNGLTFYAATSSWGKLIFTGAVGFVLFALPTFLEMTPATLTGYVLTFTYLMLPFNNLINNIPVLSKASISLSKIEALGLSLSDRAEFTSAIPAVKESWQRLELQGVTHTYRTDVEDTSFTLGPANLTFKPGEVVMIVGGNGSGKSTLAKLITGLYIPESGTIALNGQPIDGGNREWFRQHFSVVFADFFLFDRLLGLERTDLDEQAREYLKKLQLDRKVTVHEGQLSTTNVSQGQRKRLALLTAYLEDRPIYLFDEWASDQDPVFKEVFYTELLLELKQQGKTAIVISHDDHYFHLADRIIKLDYGQIEYDRQVSAS